MKTNIQFMKMRGLFFGISLIVIVASLLSIFVLNGFNQGIDFTGGLTANLNINFYPSDIGQLRSLFDNVTLQKKMPNGKTAPIIVNLGRNISSLETEEKKPYPSKSYLIRIKNIPGVEKEQVERILPAVLATNFQQITIATFSVRGKRPEDSGRALATMLAPLGITTNDIVRSRINQISAGVTNSIPLFLIKKEFKQKINETEMRNTINRLFLNSAEYEISNSLEFVSTLDWGSFNSVAATIGEKLRESAVLLSLAVIFIILIYIALRFDAKFGLAAIVALLHDVIILLGVISLTGRELNTPIVAAILTIFGYSINDTIVVFDRIRENLKFSRKEDLPDIINRSINQSLSRTIITSITTLLAVLAIYFFAGAILRDFAFALLVGILVGTYSSIYIASPLYLLVEQASGSKELKNKKGSKGLSKAQA